MTIPFAEHNASHFETTIEARKGHFVGKRERGRTKFQHNEKILNLTSNLLLEISLPLDTEMRVLFFTFIEMGQGSNL